MLEGFVPFPPQTAERYLREGHWRRQTIAQALGAAARRHAAARPGAIAVADARRAVGFTELLGESARLAALLESHGVKRGDRIIVQLPNRVEFATLTLACAEIGVVPLMALPAFRHAELEPLIALAKPVAIAIAPRYRGFDHAALARALCARHPPLRTIFTTEPVDGAVALDSKIHPRGEIGSRGGDPFEVAMMLLSGGTTGVPKLIPRTHADYLSGAEASTPVCAVTERSRILIAIPIEHNFALGAPGLIGALLAGATTILSESTHAGDLARIAAAERATHLPCVPALALSLLELPDRERANLASLRVITVGGQRLQEPTARALRRAFPDLAVQQVLGMSEGMLCYTRLDEGDELACTTQGRPASAGDEIRVVRADGTDAQPGETGELWCRGPYTIRGYYRAPKENRVRFSTDGFYRTGDLVRRTPSGNLIVEGRIKDQINRGGEKISAEEIEAHIIAHPAVTAAAVVGMPDARMGEKACAFVTLAPGAMLSLEALCAFLAERGLARFKLPERVEVIEAMPLTNVGKIKKAELKLAIERQIAAERAARVGE
ncbi:MAG TPA: AMP-binding protein [Candidatus Binataceae bacterium]|nr:AMP-binding protein [Candidatus Binataceae bacterium]